MWTRSGVYQGRMCLGTTSHNWQYGGKGPLVQISFWQMADTGVWHYNYIVGKTVHCEMMAISNIGGISSGITVYTG